MKKQLFTLLFTGASLLPLCAETTTHHVEAELTPLTDGKTVHVKADLKTLKNDGNNEAHNKAVLEYLTPKEHDKAFDADVEKNKAEAKKMHIDIEATDKDGKIEFSIKQVDHSKHATMFAFPGGDLNPFVQKGADGTITATPFVMPNLKGFDPSMMMMN